MFKIFPIFGEEKNGKNLAKFQILAVVVSDQHALAYGISRTGLDWTGLVKRGLLKPGVVKRGLVKRTLVERGLVKYGLVK